MIRVSIPLVCLWAIPLWLGIVRAGSTETNEILQVLPADTAACFILEDLGPAYDRVVSSPSFQEIKDKPIIQRWMKSPSYLSFQGLLAFLPLYFGVDNNTLLHELVGSSVVLSLRPPTDEQQAVGILACRATTATTLDRIVENLTRPLADRTVQKLEHRGYPFFERREFGQRHDFLLRLGQVLLVSDQRSAIEQVIETSQSQRGLLTSPKFEQMRRRVEPGAVASLLVDPVAFHPLVDRAVESTSGAARPVAERVAGWWRQLDWGAVSVRMSDRISISLDFSADPSKLGAQQNRFLSDWTEPTPFWDSLPSDTLTAASTKMDFVALVQLAEELAQTEPSLAGLMDACEALSVGFDAEKEILPSLGPSVGFVARVDDSGSLQGVLDLPLARVERKGPMGLTLAQSIEMLVFRPLLVFYAGDHNLRLGDHVRVDVEEVEGFRVHSMSGSTLLPDRYRPGFAVSEDRIFLVSSPEALAHWLTADDKKWHESPEAREIREALGPQENLKAYVHLERAADYWKQQAADPSLGLAAGQVDDLTSLVSSAKMATLSSSREGSLWRTTLTIFPKSSSTPSR